MSLLVNVLVGILTALITAVIGVIVWLATKQIPISLIKPSFIADGILTPKRRLRCAKYAGVQNAYTVHGFLKVPIFEATGTGVTFLTMLSSSQAALDSKIDTVNVPGSSIKCLVTEAERAATYKPVHVIGIESKAPGRINLVSTFSGVEGHPTEARSASIALPRSRWVQLAVVVSRWKGVLVHKVRLGDGEWVTVTIDVNNSYQAPPELMLVGDPTETVNCAAVDYTVSKLSIESNVMADADLNTLRITSCTTCDKELGNVPSCAVAGDVLISTAYEAAAAKTAEIAMTANILKDNTAVKVDEQVLNTPEPVTQASFKNLRKDGFDDALSQGVSRGIYCRSEEYVPYRHDPNEVNLLAAPPVVGAHDFTVFVPPTERVPRYVESTASLAITTTRE